MDEGVETTNFIDEAKWTASDQSSSASKQTAGGGMPDAAYLQQSQIIEIKESAGSQFVFMPFGLAESAVIWVKQSNLNDKGSKDALQIKWKHPVRSVEENQVAGINARLVTFAGVHDMLLLVPLSAAAANVDAGASSLKGSDGWALISLANAKAAPMAVAKLMVWLAATPCQKLVQRELDEVERWRVRPTVHFTSDNEGKLWRQSEIILRMAQVREAPDDSAATPRHNRGLIIASLPDGAWWVPWVRDMVYATLALAQIGHRHEAEMAVQAFFQARPAGKLEKEIGFPYQVSVVRYFGDGAEEPFFTMEGATNIELDNWGLVLFALGEYCRLYPDSNILKASTYRGTVYESAKNFVVEPLLASLEPYGDGLIVKKDTSIWEEKEKDKKHFAFTTICAIKGLESFTELARAAGDEALCQKLASKTELLRRGFKQAFVSSGKIRGAIEDGIKNEVDGAMLAAINLGIESDPTTIAHTVEAMSALKVASGGYLRVHSIVTDPAIFEYWYERQEFLFINFSMAQVFLRSGQAKLAEALIAPMVEKAAQDNFVVPEMYVSQVNYRFPGAIGDPIGAIPMVGYGAGVYTSYIIEREKLLSATKGPTSKF